MGLNHRSLHIETVESARSIAELLRWRADSHGDRIALEFLADGETNPQAWTYGELDRRASEIAAWLSEREQIGNRALLVFPSGLDFVAAFFGCLYAGVTAVPAYPPRRRRSLDRLGRIAGDCGATIVLSTSDLIDEQGAALGSSAPFADRPWQAIESIVSNQGNARAPLAEGNPLAFLQYTSGSTGIPKGVSVSHRNLIENQQTIRAIFQQDFDHIVMAGWLPMYHDMGLVGNLLHPLYMGGKLVFMPAMAFVQKPLRWLQLITRYRATISGGPNFAYALCVARTSAEERAQLDLASWQVAFNGSEPLRYDTLREFEQVFAPHGFSEQALCPCYGMAETTLMVTGSQPCQRWLSLAVDADALRMNRISPVNAAADNATMLVSSGTAQPDVDLRIVDPQSRQPVADGQVGEVWIAAPSVAQGYWAKEELTAETFGATIDDDQQQTRYLRTGDLGCLQDGQLYVTGRSKDLIIVNGANHYPQDIEQTVEASHPDLAPGSGIAFALDRGGVEQVFVAQEVSRGAWRSFDLPAMVTAVYRAVWEEHEVALDGFLLVRPGGIPKTTSGKLQRRLTCQMFQDDALPVLASWQRDVDGAPFQLLSPTAPADSAASAHEPGSGQRVSVLELQDWLRTRVAELAGIDPAAVSIQQPLALYGLKSLGIVRIAGELSQRLGRELAPTLAFDYPTIEALCRHLLCDDNGDRATFAALVTSDEPVAIIGLACRFPGADSIDSLQDLLWQGRSAIGPMPSPRQLASNGRSSICGSSVSRGGFLPEIDRFDPLFFLISPREAQELDPQQRLMLEVCWEAFEHGGMTQQRLAEQATGVFVGVSGNEYARLMTQSGHRINGYTATGNSLALVANRISYTFDLRGPSITIDTACSSSLVAVHLATESLRRGECDVAIAGGVSLMSAPDITEGLNEAGMLSPRGASSAFSAEADGFVRGEGCGAVLLKRLSEAVRDGDRILGVLRGSAINQDGRSNGLTAPNGLAQQAVIRSALARAGVAPDDVDYLEAHGTGTELGDPIEMSAISAVFCPRARPLWVGSVKTNIGHLEGAAGIAGLIKTCLALDHEALPPHLHWERPSPHIDWQPQVGIPTTLTDWPRDTSRVRRAGVSSFGFGGTNAHIILEEAPAPVATSTPATPPACNWLKLSAKTPEALRALATRYADALESGSLATTELEPVVLAASAGRSDFAHRWALRVTTRHELIANLRAGHSGPDVYQGEYRRPLRVGWFFPELTTTDTNIVAEALSARYPVFRQAWQEASALVPQQASPAVRGCALQAALVPLWRSFGILPSAVQGTGSGRFAAALAAGVLTLEETLRLATLAEAGAKDELQRSLAQLPPRPPQCLWLVGSRSEPLNSPATIQQWLDDSASPEALQEALARVVDAPLLTFTLDAAAGLETLGASLMQLYVRGAELDWSAVQASARCVVSLPSYPFQRQRCWFHEPPTNTNQEQKQTTRAGALLDPSAGTSTLLGARLDVAGTAIVYETDLSRFPSLADHRLHGQSVFPATGYLELALAAAYESVGRALDVCELRFEQALHWEPSCSARLQVVLEPEGPAVHENAPHSYRCQIAHRTSGGWQRQASCRLLSHDLHSNGHAHADHSRWSPQGQERSISEHYAQCQQAGLDYTGLFRGLRTLQATDDVAWGEVHLPEQRDSEEQYRLHPALLDACLQCVAPLLPPVGLWLPVAIERYHWHNSDDQPIDALRVVVRLHDSQQLDRRRCTLHILDLQNNPIAEIENLELKLLPMPAVVPPADNICYEECWEPRTRLEEQSAPPKQTASELGSLVCLHRPTLLQQTGYAIDLASRGCLDRLSLHWAVSAMREVLGPVAVGSHLAHGLADRLALASEKRPLFHRLLEILTEEGYLSTQADGWRIEKELARQDCEAESDRALRAYPRLAPEILLLARCGRKLSDVLRGDDDPLPILFSDKSPGSATEVYTRAAGARLLNGLLAEAAAAIADQLPPGRALRILEIGAGTGATTRQLIERLPPNRICYTFTDIARGFLTAAQEEFGDERSIAFKRLDIESDPRQQGFAPESFDVIVAANVLHATARLDATLAHVESLLAPGGQLLLLEGTHPVRWLDLTFGLTDSWWRFAEHDPERSHALVSPAEWRSLLGRRGFDAVDVVSPEESQGDTAENVLIIATKDAASQPTGALKSPASSLLILALDPHAGRALAESIEASGRRCQLIDLAESAPELMADELRNTLCQAESLPQVVFVSAMNSEAAHSLGAITPEDTSEITVEYLLRTIQTVLAHHRMAAASDGKPRMTLVTRGAQRVSEADECVAPADTAARALMRTLALERPEIHCRTIDVDPRDERPWESAAQELLVTDMEPEVAIRGGVRYVLRLRSWPLVEGLPATRVLRIGSRGHLDTLALEHVARRALQPDEIEIEVRASGLNFRDVLNALGKYPEEVPLGAECAGVVSRVGSSVDEFAVGDAVIAIAADCFAESVVVPAVAAVRKPEAFDFSMAASLPVAYLTAAVALELLANVQPGERVLIHAATGGVGIAAMELALARGAELYVTASAPKQSFLYGRGLNRVYDSRSAGFATKILADSQGAGVDVVLNLLDESFAAENLRALAPGGRYIDITKPSAGLVDKIRELRPDVEYHCFDLAKLLRDDPSAVRTQLEPLLHRVASGELASLPYRSFALDSAPRAFRAMQQARHIGKLVLCPTRRYAAARRARSISVRRDGAYAIIGGLGDLGMLSARLLAEQHAGLIALVGRSEPTPTQQTVIDALRADGARLLVLRADASDREQLARALETVRRQMPLVGVIHSAGVLADALVEDQSRETLDRVFDAKVRGAWHLHELTASDPIELFAMYSSIASVLGAPGQANHAAANAFLDGLADHRLSRGLPVTSINWGPWSEVGEAARRQVQTRGDLRGLGMISLDTGTRMLRSLLLLTDLRVAVVPLSIEACSPRLRESPLFEAFRDNSHASHVPCVGLRDQLARLPASSQYDWLVEQVTITLARVLGMDGDETISPVTAFKDLGLDSLTSIEFIDALNRQWGTNQQSSAVYDYPTSGALARNLLTLINPPAQPQNETPAAEVEPDTAAPSQATLAHEGSFDVSLQHVLGQENGNSSLASSPEIEQGLSKLLTELLQWKT
jgi:acyl transferase domain-containing protein/acyl-CoA synthetase (AMP-forming)/AMP-acid ligase II/acyl carrier protein